MSGEAFAFFLLAVGRLGSYVAVIICTGLAVFHFVALRGVRTDQSIDAGDFSALTNRLAGWGILGACCLLLVGAGRLYAQTYSIFGLDEGVTLGFIGTVAWDTTWGEGWTWQMLAAALLVVAFALARYLPRFGWFAALGAVFAVGGTVPLTGHAVSRDPVLASVVLQVVHVWAAGVWLGTLFVVMRVGIPRLVAGHGVEASRIVDAFSPLALGAVIAIGASGIVTAVIYLDSWPELWGGAYGLTLLLKLAVFGGVAVCGAYNWRSVRPRLRADANMALLTRWANVELTLAAVVIAVTSVLVALPLGHE